MTLLLWLVVGGVIGWIASLIVNTDQDMGIVANVIVGIVGGLIGGTIGSFLFNGKLDFNNALSSFEPISLLMALAGSVLLLVAIKAFKRNPKY